MTINWENLQNVTGHHLQANELARLARLLHPLPSQTSHQMHRSNTIFLVLYFNCRENERSNRHRWCFAEILPDVESGATL